MICEDDDKKYTVTVTDSMITSTCECALFHNNTIPCQHVVLVPFIDFPAWYINSPLFNTDHDTCGVEDSCCHRLDDDNIETDAIIQSPTTSSSQPVPIPPADSTRDSSPANTERISNMASSPYNPTLYVPQESKELSETVSSTT